MIPLAPRCAAHREGLHMVAEWFWIVGEWLSTMALIGMFLGLAVLT